jgi:hypothetical protein
MLGSVNLPFIPSQKKSSRITLATYPLRPDATVPDQLLFQNTPVDGNPFAVFSARSFICAALTVKRVRTNTMGQAAAG